MGIIDVAEFLTQSKAKPPKENLKVNQAIKAKTSSEKCGIGRRKTSVARVILVPGLGSMFVNGRRLESYLQFNEQYINAAKVPLTTLGLENKHDIHVNAHGGGLKGQADAIKLGVARALAYMYPEDRVVLKSAGLLTRDSRRK